MHDGSESDRDERDKEEPGRHGSEEKKYREETGWPRETEVQDSEFWTRQNGEKEPEKEPEKEHFGKEYCVCSLGQYITARQNNLHNSNPAHSRVLVSRNRP